MIVLNARIAAAIDGLAVYTPSVDSKVVGVGGSVSNFLVTRDPKQTWTGWKTPTAQVIETGQTIAYLLTNGFVTLPFPVAVLSGETLYLCAAAAGNYTIFLDDL